MQIKIDFRSGQPIYIQIVEQIQHMIANGDLNEGEQLPTVRQLATDLRVNWNTVARAYRLLDESGLISTQQGRGTYVWSAPSEETTRLIHRQVIEGLTRHYLAEAARLGFTPEEVKENFLEQIAAWLKGTLPQEAPAEQ